MRRTYLSQVVSGVCYCFCFAVAIEVIWSIGHNGTKDVVGQEVPPGFKTIVIEVRDPSDFERSLKEGNRVDVAWSFPQNGAITKATIARLVKVLSLTNKVATADDGVREKQAFKANLLVSEEQYKDIEEQYRNIELARSPGFLEIVSSLPSRFKMISIEIKDPSEKESAVNMNDWVDVLWSLDGRTKKATIARLVKVLSIRNSMQQSTEKGKVGSLNVDLMVTQEQFRYINAMKSGEGLLLIDLVSSAPSKNEDIYTVGKEFPPGFKTITVEVKDPSEFERTLKKGDRVAMIREMLRGGIIETVTLARSVIVLSVTNPIEQDADNSKIVASNVLLLVSEEQYKLIDAVKAIGGFRFVDIFSGEAIRISSEAFTDGGLRSPYSGKEENKEVGGEHLYEVDPKTGKRLRYILLKNRKWILDKSYVDPE